MNTRRYPRTLEQAFGPYARGPIEEPNQPMPTADIVALVVSILAALALICFIAVGWVK